MTVWSEIVSFPEPRTVPMGEEWVGSEVWWGGRTGVEGWMGATARRRPSLSRDGSIVVDGMGRMG